MNLCFICFSLPPLLCFDSSVAGKPEISRHLCVSGFILKLISEEFDNVKLDICNLIHVYDSE